MAVSYTKFHLLEALGNAGLPHTYQALLKYERLGVIKPPKQPLRYGDSKRVWRFYTKDEIQAAVKSLKAHKRLQKPRKGAVSI